MKSEKKRYLYALKQKVFLVFLHSLTVANFLHSIVLETVVSFQTVVNCAAFLLMVSHLVPRLFWIVFCQRKRVLRFGFKELNVCSRCSRVHITNASFIRLHPFWNPPPAQRTVENTHFQMRGSSYVIFERFRIRRNFWCFESLLAPYQSIRRGIHPIVNLLISHWWIWILTQTNCDIFCGQLRIPGYM